MVVELIVYTVLLVCIYYSWCTFLWYSVGCVLILRVSTLQYSTVQYSSGDRYLSYECLLCTVMKYIYRCGICAPLFLPIYSWLSHLVLHLVEIMTLNIGDHKQRAWTMPAWGPSRSKHRALNSALCTLCIIAGFMRFYYTNLLFKRSWTVNSVMCDAAPLAAPYKLYLSTTCNIFVMNVCNLCCMQCSILYELTDCRTQGAYKRYDKD
jgi:hypothetical protein